MGDDELLVTPLANAFPQDRVHRCSHSAGCQVMFCLNGMLVKRCRQTKEALHFRHPGRLPRSNRSVKCVCKVKQVIHSSNSECVPITDGLVKYGGVLAQASQWCHLGH
jgi:hypothetical protein